MSNTLNISQGLRIPQEYVTQTGALLAVRGAGKTNAGRVLAEEFFNAGLPFVAIDPVGSWYGLRSGRDGSALGGLPIFIFGGDHGDVPLTRGSGELVADLVVEQRLTCVVDLSSFEDESDKKHFLLKFARRLYQKNRDPLHLFLEEADDYIPQKPMKDELHLKRAWENIVRRGRGRGIGLTIITQRSAVVNKDVLTQVENLFVLRTTGPQDIAAIEGWVKYHKVDQGMLESLSGLDDGEAWVWSPHFLGKFERIKFRRSATFDSGATPKNLTGKATRKVSYLRDVDVTQLKSRLAETIEQARQENPAVLRAQITKLKEDLRRQQIELERAHSAEVPSVKTNVVDLGKLGSLIEELREVSTKTEQSALELARLLHVQRQVGLAPKGGGVATLYPTPSGKPKAASSTKDGGVRLDACPRALLGVLLQYYPSAATDSQVSILSGYSIKSSSFANGLSFLRTAGYVEGSREDLRATEKALLLGLEFKPIPTGTELLAFWRSKLDAAPRALLSALYKVYPHALPKHLLSEDSGYSATSSSFANGLSTLRSLRLIETSVAGTFKIVGDFFR